MDKDKIRKTIDEIEKLLQELSNQIGLGLEKEITSKNTSNKKTVSKKQEIDFKLNSRAFMNRYGKSMNGQKRFTLLLAYIAKGEIGKEVLLAEIQSVWNTMSAIMGGKFNYKYPTTAKTFGWVDSKKKAFYCLGASWNEIFDE